MMRLATTAILMMLCILPATAAAQEVLWETILTVGHDHSQHPNDPTQTRDTYGWQYFDGMDVYGAIGSNEWLIDDVPHYVWWLAQRYYNDRPESQVLFRTDWEGSSEDTTGFLPSVDRNQLVLHVGNESYRLADAVMNSNGEWLWLRPGAQQQQGRWVAQVGDTVTIRLVRHGPTPTPALPLAGAGILAALLMSFRLRFRPGVRS